MKDKIIQFIINAIVISLAVYLGSNLGGQYMQSKAIEQGCGAYHPKTGSFEWVCGKGEQ